MYTEFGSCPAELSCIRFGWFESDSNYCSVSKGCQSEFGECRCGKNEFGSFPKGLCYSKYGWCGLDTKYCSMIKGCQLKYGKYK